MQYLFETWLLSSAQIDLEVEIIMYTLLLGRPAKFGILTKSVWL